MSNLAQLEATFQRYVSDLERWVPDGITNIDLELLQRLGLIESLDDETVDDQAKLAQYFHVVETTEKITLFNDEFAIWIVPEIHDNRPVTYALVGKQDGEQVSLEIVISAMGVYNSSRTMLRVIDKMLLEINHTNQELEDLQNM